jgi:hypothetical protein
MSAAGLLLVSILAVPPGEMVIDHNQPGQWGHQPVVRYFVRRPVDDARGHAWMIHCDVLDRLWAEYRAAGSTPHAWDVYKRKAAAAKRYYVYQDPYYVAQVWQVNVPMVHPAAAPRRFDPAWRGSATLSAPEAVDPGQPAFAPLPGPGPYGGQADPAVPPNGFAPDGYPAPLPPTEPGSDSLPMDAAPQDSAGAAPAAPAAPGSDHPGHQP